VRLLVWAWALGTGLAVGGEAGRVLLGTNFHVVDAGKVYRGAQPTGEILAELVSGYHIRTVVNLRGCSDACDWYLEESRATQRLGLQQEDVNFSSGRLPSATEVRRLVEVLDHAEYPLFLHCRRGADRTGMAAAVYLLLETDTTFATARKQLSWRYGHVSARRTGLLDRFIDLYADWLRDHGVEHTRAHFRQWLMNEYRGGGACYVFESVTCAGGNPRAGRPIKFDVRVRNTGTNTWRLRPGRTAGIQLGYTVWDDQDQMMSDGFWGLFDAEVAPGEAIDLAVVVPPLPRPGRYRLLLDMVDAQHGWFYQVGSEPYEEEWIVRE
jgi:hypothetical protein